MTELFYVFVLLIAFILSYWAQKKNKKIYVYIIIILLTIIAGFRGKNCGIDTALYYDNISNGFPYKWQFREEGFRLIANFFVNTFNNPQLMFIFCAFFTNYFIFIRLWDFKDEANYSFMCFLYLTIYFTNSMNIMRQYLAVAIIFWATRFLKEKKVIFLICLLISYFIHRSSLLAIGYIAIALWSNFSKKQKKLFFIPMIGLFLFEVVYVKNHLSTDIEAYSLQKVENINITFIYFACATISAMMFYLYKINIKPIGHFSKRIEESYNIESNILYYVIIGLVLRSLSMFFSFVGRTGLYYSIFDIVFWGIACKKFKNAQINRFLILLYAIYIFGHILIKNDALLFPYHMFLYK